MRWTIRRGVLLAACLCSGSGTIHGADRLAIRVSPMISSAPAFVTVHFRSLPEGSYAVTVILTGTQGRRALQTRTILVGMPEDRR